jgi:cell division cycle 20, cofactor of APC complex
MDIVEFENMMDLSTSFTSSKSTRWERKAASQSNGGNDQSPRASKNTNECSDRFIPNRSGMQNNRATFGNTDENCQNDSDESNASQSNTSVDLAKILNANDNGTSNGNDVGQNTRVLAFKNKAPAPKDGYQNSLKVLYSSNTTKRADVAKPMRHISSTPCRVLDAPELLNDYYLNLLSWGPTNTLAVALSQYVYLWDAASGSIKELMNLDNESDDYVSCVSWLPETGSHLAVGTANSAVQLWDVEAGKAVRTMDGHASRVGALAWNGHILSSGSRDTSIINHDVRIRDHCVGKMNTHTQEVCGLAWSPDGQYLASGANDNTLCIWDAATSCQSQDVQPVHTLREHQAAVKALAWSPHERNLLASGGGTADRTIKFWNASSGTLVNSIDTGSQVCALQWSPFEKEILSSHGYAENQLTLWKYPTMARMKEFKGHTERVLHMACSPDGSMVCSGAADETLRFWNIFASESKKKSDSSASGALSRGSSKSLMIR